MKDELIYKLLDADFSKDEIIKVLDIIDGVSPSEPPATAPFKGQGKDPEPAVDDLSGASAAGSDPIDYTDVIRGAIQDGFKDLSKVLQASEIGRSRLPEESNEDILANIIAPKMKERV